MELKARGQTFKSVAFNFYGTNPETPSRRELAFTEVPAKADDWGYEFGNPISRFTLSNNEIAVLHKFINGLFPDEGFYVRTDSKQLAAVLAERIASNSLDASAVTALLEALGNDQESIRAVSQSSQAGRLATVIENERHIVALDELEHLALESGTSEGAFQKLLQENAWIFGGRYIGLTERRSLTVLDQLDVPLIGVDGSLHVVELKTADVPRLFRRHRNHWIVGTEVHEAVAQAQNYLFSLDSEAHSISATLKVDAYRTFATVIVGHSVHCTKDIADNEASMALRVYNSHLSRVRVMTYDQLLANARNAVGIGAGGAGDAV